MKRLKKILLISSSTGGHAIPVFEIAKGLQKFKNIKPIVIHSGSEIELKLFSGIDSVLIRSGKLNRYKRYKNIVELIKILFAVIKSLAELLIIRPELIFSKGGFNGAPILFWARIFKIPYFLHESDSEMGLANKYFYKNSVKTFVSFPKEMYKLDSSKLDYSGMIIRDFDKIVSGKVLKRPLILITGGSQGAVAINDCIFDSLNLLVASYEVVHHVGASDELRAKEAASKLDPEVREHYHYFTFSDTIMMESLKNADLIISRAGSTIGEIAKLRKASILIPYPYSASGHQIKNARFLEKIGGAIVVNQDKLNSDNLIKRIKFVLSDKRNQKILGDNAHKAIQTNGKDYIVEELMKFIEEK